MLAVMRRRPQPQRNVLQGWIDAARDKTLAHETTIIWGGGFRTKQNRSVHDAEMEQWASSQKHHNGRRQQHAQKDPNAMEIDAIRKKLTPEELKKLRAEGRCFYCRKQGHMSQNCPDKQKSTGHT